MSIFRHYRNDKSNHIDYISDSQKIFSETSLSAARVLQSITIVFMVTIATIFTKEYLGGNHTLWLMLPLLASFMSFNFASNRVKVHSAILNSYFGRMKQEELEERSESKLRKR